MAKWFSIVPWICAKNKFIKFYNAQQVFLCQGHDPSIQIWVFILIVSLGYELANSGAEHTWKSNGVKLVAIVILLVNCCMIFNNYVNFISITIWAIETGFQLYSTLHWYLRLSNKNDPPVRCPKASHLNSISICIHPLFLATSPFKKPYTLPWLIVCLQYVENGLNAREGRVTAVMVTIIHHKRKPTQTECNVTMWVTVMSPYQNLALPQREAVGV